jgi:SIR2-like domain
MRRARHARVTYIQPLLRRLRDYRPYPIVSLNYDNVVELGCAHAGLRFAERIAGERADRSDIELVKLHGSVTWMQRAGGGVERIRDYGNQILRRLGEVRSPILETPMIYPSRRKLPIHEPFMRNALRFQELLADPRFRLCIVVGYSFPDAHVRSWLAEALKARPELRICLVGPTPELRDEALDNLTKNLRTIPWTERLSIVKATFGEAIGARPDGLENAVAAAEPFGPRVAYGTPAARTRTVRYAHTGRVAGIGAAPDGDALFVSEPGGRVLKIDLRTDRTTVVTDRMRDPRGIAVAADGRLFVVENAALQWWRRRGVGAIVEIAARGGSPRVLNRAGIVELIGAFRRYRNGARGDALWADVESLLRWPTDVVIAGDGTVFATEARALVKLDGKKPPQRVAEPALVFNLHGLDPAPDGALVGVEEGVAQDLAWGRVERFVPAPGGMQCMRSEAVEGTPKLMGICFVPPLSKVVVTQGLTWPHGRLIVLDYPSLENARFLDGFDLPGKVKFLPKRDLLAVGTRHGVELVNIAALKKCDVKPV